MCKCDWKNCLIRKQICEETQKAIDEGKEPKGFCPQCLYCAGNCKKKEDINGIRRSYTNFKRFCEIWKIL